MGDFGKLLLYGIAYHANKASFEAGKKLLSKQNKTDEEKIAAKSFSKIIHTVGILFGVSLSSVVLSVANFMLSIVLDADVYYKGISLIIVVFVIIFAPICMVISGIIPRSSYGK